MKKFFTLLLSLTLIFLTEVCSAMNHREQLENEMNLGGIFLEMSYQDVINRYGEPNRREKGQAQLIKYSIYYGDSVKINFGFKNQVIGIEVTADNGWHTPFGIHVGMSMEKIFGFYGEPNFIIKPNANQQWTGYVFKYEIPQVDMTRGSITRAITVYCDSVDGNVKALHIWKEEYDPVPMEYLNK
ncbi:MAG: hypothetical protein IJ728_01705 [Selenomonadaceae bacterium]|nr:hypothetical protein [Selenomonadaceae bacterium]